MINNQCEFLRIAIDIETNRATPACLASNQQIAGKVPDGVCATCPGASGDETEIAQNYQISLQMLSGELNTGLPKRPEVQELIGSLWGHVKTLVEPLYEPEELDLLDKIVRQAYTDEKTVKNSIAHNLLRIICARSWAKYQLFTDATFNNEYTGTPVSISEEDQLVERQRQAQIALSLHDFFSLTSDLNSSPVYIFGLNNERYGCMPEQVDRAKKIKSVTSEDINYQIHKIVDDMFKPDLESLRDLI